MALVSRGTSERDANVEALETLVRTVSFVAFIAGLAVGWGLAGIEIALGWNW
jgi:hypothetical protein